MCGICGIVEVEGRPVSEAALSAMTRALAHRGPDGEATYVAGHVGFGHRRLSIIDLPGGAQPIANEDGSVVVIFNGEVFNYRELTEGLTSRGHVFRTRSDTETIVHLYEELGIELVHKLRGMFAFALLDRRRGEVYLVRDRFGIKPLYYHQRQGVLYFASEIAPLMRAGYSVEVNRPAIHHYLQTRFPYDDETLFKGVHRVREGAFLKWSNGGGAAHTYYPNPTIAPRDDRRDFEGEFDAAFADAVKAWMVADVPVGAYLSGGVDSSVLVSEMAAISAHPVRTFSVHFSEGHSEAAVAERTAKALGCDHQTVVCGIDELLELPSIVRVIEEPVGDAIFVAQYALARAAARSGLKTVVTGDGADESLGGYQHLRAIAEMTTWSERLPAWLFATVGASVARRLPLRIIEAMADLPLDVARDSRERLATVLGLLPEHDMRALYDELVALYTPAEYDEIYTDDFRAEVAGFAADSFAGVPAGTTTVGRVLSMQFRHWLPGMINLKQDRVCMAHALENRVPFLDHQLVELMASLPDRFKIDGRRNKIILRRLAATRVDPSVAGATKMPFHLPLQSYLADPRLWSLVEDNLEPARVRRRGIIRPDYVARVKIQARTGDYLAAKKMFALVILEIWFRTFSDGESL
jgi:asparagine synthase (glutamine-hydrolysing)